MEKGMRVANPGYTTSIFALLDYNFVLLFTCFFKWLHE